ncbi:FAD-dependent monooxygenase [uncultured Hyphomonas sp.]|uniref:FAD-dependent monooxygenase n=1 Tax=uncultured Hyphomonas sp. TaxID=225298 RepID=UPI000C3C7655|nr:2-polyprenyl-6-methoxyphenol hydroxylase [Hyphomonadaceae bacterium]MBA27679.1 2-polyprenyl-6-methoxyphenol hydroxylase [Hyphomonadaceae bacterium]
MERYDVIVAGAGPVGLTLAIDLGQRGIRTLILERNNSTGPWPKMDRSNARTMEFYRRLGIADQVRALGYPDDASMDVFIVTRLCDEPLLKLHYPTVAEFRQRISETTDHSQPLEPYQLVSQNKLEPLLKSVAEATPHVTVRYGCDVLSFHDMSDRVVIEYSDPDDNPVKVCSTYLVGCDGGSSTIRKQLGIKLEGQGNLRSMRQICFYSEQLYENIPMGKGRHYYFADAEGSALIVQGDRKEFTLNSDVPEDIDYESWVREKVGPGIEFDFKLLNVSPWNLHLLLAEKYGNGRVFLAGDAAHLVIPTGGLGMNSGVGDALDLSWKLSGTIKGWGGPGLLSSYEAERRPVGVKNVEASGWAAQGLGKWRALHSPKLMEETREGARERLRTARSANLHHRRVHEMVGAEYGYSYAGSPLITPSQDTPAEWDTVRFLPRTDPGVRIPHIWLSDDSSILDRMGAYFTFVDLTGQADTSDIEDAFSHLHAPMVTFSQSEPHVQSVYGCKFLLVRPDLHIVWTGNVLPDHPRQLARLAAGFDDTPPPVDVI